MRAGSCIRRQTTDQTEASFAGSTQPKNRLSIEPTGSPSAVFGFGRHFIENPFQKSKTKQTGKKQ